MINAKVWIHILMCTQAPGHAKRSVVRQKQVRDSVNRSDLYAPAEFFVYKFLKFLICFLNLFKLYLNLFYLL